MPNALTGISMYPFNYNRKRTERDQTKQSIKLNRSRKRNKKKTKKDRTWRWMGRQLVKFCVVFVCYELHSRTSKLVSNYRVNSLALGFLAGFTHSKIFYITLAKLTHTKFILLGLKHKEELPFAHTHTHLLAFTATSFLGQIIITIPRPLSHQGWQTGTRQQTSSCRSLSWHHKTCSRIWNCIINGLLLWLYVPRYSKERLHSLHFGSIQSLRSSPIQTAIPCWLKQPMEDYKMHEKNL